jgi:hypothetical protein
MRLASVTTGVWLRAAHLVGRVVRKPLVISWCMSVVVLASGGALGTAMTAEAAQVRSGSPPATDNSVCGSASACRTPAPSTTSVSSHERSNALLPPSNPYSNVTPEVNFQCSYGTTVDDSPGCIYSLLVNIDYARSLEGVGPMILPTNYATLAPPQQLLAVFNLERTSRGLPPFLELDDGADANATVGALASEDPPFLYAGNFQGYDSIAAFGITNALYADWEWMYTDGCYPYEGSGDCTSISPTDPGGWGHRDAILGSYGASVASAGAAEAVATSGQYPGLMTWTAQLGDYVGAIPNSATDFLNSSITYPSSAAPYLLDVNPPEGTAGAAIALQGVYFTGASAVYFGGSNCAATPTVSDDQDLTVIVPSCASGNVQLQVDASSSLSNAVAFTVAQPSSLTVPPPSSGHGYWLVGSDGGIFTFGSAQFYGSTGSLRLQRPVVGIVPTADRAGYWLDASDGGVFSYGDTQYYGSIPGLGFHPAGSGLPNSLNAPIVGMVPSIDDGGYFMVASDGGVFAFGDAHFAGSCPGIGGCSGSAVAVMPDHSGDGYWLVTSTGSVYTFGDAPYFGAPGHGTVTSAVPTPDGKGYWILLSNGQVFAYGAAANLGSPASSNFNGLDAASAIFATSDGEGYWVSSALGAVFPDGDAPNYGGMSGTHLNGSIIAATGF